MAGSVQRQALARALRNVRSDEEYRALAFPAGEDAETTIVIEREHTGHLCVRIEPANFGVDGAWRFQDDVAGRRGAAERAAGLAAQLSGVGVEATIADRTGGRHAKRHP